MDLPNLQAFSGEYPSMPDSVYHGPETRGYLSASTLKSLIERSPAHARLTVEHEDGPADDKNLVVGSGFHCRVLRPAAFNQEFLAMKEAVDRRTKAGKAAFDAAEAEAAVSGRTLLRVEEAEIVHRLSDAVTNDREAMDLLRRTDRVEHAYFGEVETDGGVVYGRAKPDAWTPGGIAIDLKSFGSVPTDHAVEADARKYGWAVQCAWYSRVVEAAGFEPPTQWWFIVVEKSRPHSVRCMHMPEDAISAASAAIDRVAPYWIEGQENGCWPSLGSGTIRLPDWYLDSLRGGAA